MSEIKFKINGKEYTVGCEVCPDTSLLQYLRDTLQLCGTKYMCREAGCGACVVALTASDGTLYSVNSCVVPVLSCRGWVVTTIDQLGIRRDGYHPVQRQFAEKNATQCGHCTPGWIMTLYSLLNSGKKFTMREMEQNFASNICRCTGYRPILDVVKTYATDYPETDKLPDIEDLRICNKSDGNCSRETCEENDWCLVSKDQDDIVEICCCDGVKWYIVKYVADIFQIWNKEGTDSYMLIHGNTAKVPYPRKKWPKIIINIREVEELQKCLVDQNLVIGSGVTMTELLDIFEDMAKKDSFGYLKKFIDHLKLVAHIPVRNLGSLGGNLMIKNQHNEFPSDIYLLLDVVDAVLTIESNYGLKQHVSMRTFLKMDMKGKLILNVKLPPLTDDHYKIVTYKIMVRSQSVHAVVNAGFLYNFSSTNKVLQCRICYGNISPTFTRAFSTEKFLLGKNLFDNATLKSALLVLEKELVAKEAPPEASAKCRKQLALNLFFKGLLKLCPKSKINPRFLSGAVNIRAKRPVSTASQSYDTNKSLWPLNQSVQKLEAKIQCSGEAQYTDDIPKIAHEAFVAYVVTPVATGTITKIDATKALAHKGVIAFFSAKDLPGPNTFSDASSLPNTSTEEVFCDTNIKYMNQPVGVIVAETQKAADEGSELVVIKYTNDRPPVIDINDAIKDPKRVVLNKTKVATEKGNDIAKVIKHSDTIYGQYHFPMETIVCVVRPVDENLEVYCTTQWPDTVQLGISRALNIDSNKVEVNVRRLGGSYGLKLSRAGMPAIACSLAAYKLNRPCRLVQALTTNTRCMGKRLPCKSEWELAVNSAGVIQYSSLNMYEDNGYKINENFYLLAFDQISNCYDNKRWHYNCYDVTTDNAKNTWCRSPGTLEATAMVELKMERIAYECSLDPDAVRLANLDPQFNDKMRSIIDEAKSKSDYENRNKNVEILNSANRWKKRGIRLVPLLWRPVPLPVMEVTVTVYHGDGSVIILHGGVEMGQGINTKAAQVCASSLSIPVEKVQIKCNNTIGAPNSSLTGGSLTSQNVCFGVKKCCEILLDKLAPIKAQLKNPSWLNIVTEAFRTQVSLVAHATYTINDYDPYYVFGATVAEVEIDVLTGECEVLRVDLFEDAGQSVNPEIDIGQIEGAFIMGLGYWTCESLVYDNNTGELLTDRACNYHVPQALDIPQDFRVHLKENSYSNDAALGSKCTGEPPMCMSVVVALAIRQAISAARFDTKIPIREWFNINGPCSLESIILSTNTKIEQLVFK